MNPGVARTISIIGRGRAGGAFALALAQCGWRVRPPLGRDQPWQSAASRSSVVLLAVPDAALSTVALGLEPGPAVVLHCSGASGLGVLAPHHRRGSVHPLAALATPETGAERLVAGGWFAVSGDPVAAEIVADLGGRAVEVDDQHRVTYHAAAAIAANHLVALMGQVERIASLVGVPLAAFLDLARGSFDDVVRVGPEAALTGPVSRGDWDTVRRHLAALPDDERPAYVAMAEQAARLAGRIPHWDD